MTFSWVFYEGRQHGSVFIQRKSFLSSVGFQQSLDNNKAVYFWI